MKRIFAALVALALCGSPALARTVLTAAGNFYVTSSGSDGNDCLSTGSACATLQGAISRIYRDYDAGCQTVTINVGTGNFDGAVINGAMVGQCSTEDFLILGDTISPTAHVLTTGVAARGGARVTVKGVRITSTTGPALSADDGGSVIYGGYIDFGPVATVHITAGPFARAKMINHYYISGGGSQHINASAGQVQIMPGVIAIFTTTATVIPAFSQFILATEGGLVNISYGSSLFWNAGGFNCGPSTACATGQRYAASLGSKIYTGASGVETWLPGDAAGTVSTYSFFN